MVKTEEEKGKYCLGAVPKLQKTCGDLNSLFARKSNGAGFENNSQIGLQLFWSAYQTVSINWILYEIWEERRSPCLRVNWQLWKNSDPISHCHSIESIPFKFRIIRLLYVHLGGSAILLSSLWSSIPFQNQLLLPSPSILIHCCLTRLSLNIRRN